MNDPARRHLLGLALAAGTAPAWLRHARAADVPRFAWGIASGQPRDDGMVLWTRLSGADLPLEVSVAWEVAEDDAFTRVVARGVETARADDAYSVHAEPRGLRSDRWYRYRFAALGQRSDAGRTRTAPAAGAAVERLGFITASCQRWDAGHYAAWRHAVAEQPDLVLFLGDYIYEYASAGGALRAHAGGPLKTLADYRARYAQYKSDAALQAAHAAAPWLVIWDDHEVENDYAGLQGLRLQPDFAAQRAAAYRAWWEHMPLPAAARPVDGRLRLYGHLDWGALARFHLLDTRQQRDPQACQPPGRGGSRTLREADCAALRNPARSLLGAAQEAWLAGSWRSDRPWNLLAQQTLMARATAPRAPAETQVWTDGWDGYPAARRRLLQTVAERRVPGVVVLGGDLHANVVADLRLDADDTAAAVLASEFCGTSITSLGVAQARMDAVRAANPHIHHARSDQRGYSRFTLRPGELTAELRVLDDARDAGSGIATARRFVVDPLRAGVQAA